MEYKDYLKTLTKGQKRYLSKYECALCDYPLNRDGCGAIHKCLSCTEQARIERAKDCLQNYKPMDIK